MTVLSNQSLRELWSTVSTVATIERVTLAYIRQILQTYEEQLAGIHTIETLVSWLELKFPYFHNDILAAVNTSSEYKTTVMRCLLTELMTGALNHAAHLSKMKIADYLQGEPTS